MYTTRSRISSSSSDLVLSHEPWPNVINLSVIESCMQMAVIGKSALSGSGNPSSEVTSISILNMRMSSRFQSCSALG